MKKVHEDRQTSFEKTINFTEYFIVVLKASSFVRLVSLPKVDS